jgi:hypothetical protein
MTDETMNLRTLIERTLDADLLREMIGSAAERLMDMGCPGSTGASHRDKNPDGNVKRELLRTGWKLVAPLSSGGAT